MGAGTVKNRTEVPLKIRKQNYYMIEQFHIWVFICKKALLQKGKCTPVFITALLL